MRRFILALLIMLCLSGCGRKKEALCVYLSLLPQEEKTYQELVKRFEFATGIKVRLVSQQYLQIKQAVESEVKAGKGIVDVFEVDVYYLRALSEYVEDLTPFQAYLDKEKFYKGAYESGRMDGRLLFFPHRLSTQALVYNSKYIDSPPKTWQDYIELARRFPRKIGLKASLYEGLVCDIFPIIWSMDGDIFNLEDPNTIEALNIIKSLSGLIHPGSKGFKEMSILESQAREEIYLHFNWPFSVKYLKERNLLSSPNRIASIPQGIRHSSVLGGGYLAISKAAPHKKEAETFLRFIQIQSSQKFLFEKLNWLPPRCDVLTRGDVEFSEDLSVFVESLKYARSRPQIQNYERASQIWQEIFHSLVFKDYTVEQVIEEFRNELEPIL